MKYNHNITEQVNGNYGDIGNHFGDRVGGGDDADECGGEEDDGVDNDDDGIRFQPQT